MRNSAELCSSESLCICYKFLSTTLIAIVFLFGFELQLSDRVNGFVLLELPLQKHLLQRAKVPQINRIDNDILMDKSTSATVDTVRSDFHYFITHFIK